MEPSPRSKQVARRALELTATVLAESQNACATGDPRDLHRVSETSLSAVEKAVERRDRTGMTALHKAAEGGHQPCALLLQLQFPSLVNMRCKKGRTAGDLALRRGYGVLARELGVLVAPAGGKVKLVEPGTNDVRDKPTLLVAPPLCSEHYTFSMVKMLSPDFPAVAPSQPCPSAQG